MKANSKNYISPTPENVIYCKQGSYRSEFHKNTPRVFNLLPKTAPGAFSSPLAILTSIIVMRMFLTNRTRKRNWKMAG